jgi:hypothetical protein
LYSLRFRFPVVECAAVATIGSTETDQVEEQSLVSAYTSGVKTHRLWVETIDGPRSWADRSFHVAVTCTSSVERPWGEIRPGESWYGPNVIQSEELAPGVLKVRFRTSGHRCTYTAAIAESDFMNDAAQVNLTKLSAHGNELVLLVRTLNVDGTPDHREVYVSLVC